MSLRLTVVTALVCASFGVAGPLEAQEACCLPGGDCATVVDGAECGGLGGLILEGADCNDDPCATGACCQDIACAQADAFSCITAGRDYIGPGISCAEDPCEIGSGACCDGESCTQSTEEDCDLAGGTYVGPGTLCDAQPCAVAACCLPGACIELPQFECNQIGGVYEPGSMCNELVCTVPPECPSQSLFAHPPAPPSFFAAGVSELAADVLRFENFGGVTGPIESITWWGLDLEPLVTQFDECNESDPTFVIEMYPNEAGLPGLEPVCSYLVTATRTPLPLLYEGFQLNAYTATLPQPCPVTAGWLSIEGGGDPDCWFLWMSSDIGENISYCDTCDPMVQGFDLSVCFGGTTGGVAGACCDQGDGSCTNGVDIADCAAVGQRFEADQDCLDIVPECAATTGACCDADGNCSIASPDICVASDGLWLGADTVCDQCPSMGACCVDVGDCFITSVNNCLAQGYTWGGQGSLCETGCPDAPDCGENALVSQPPDGPSESFLAGTSEQSSIFRRWENFSGVGGAIQGMTWWGFDLDNIEGTNDFLECVESDPSFDITFHEDAAGVPGTVVCSYTLTASSEVVGFSYGGASLNEYHVDLPEPCVLTNGWVSIVGLGDAECWFLWNSGDGSDGSSWCQGFAVPSESVDLSLCLEGSEGGVFGACCDEPTGGCSEAAAIEDCLSPEQRFAPDTLCDDLEPECGVLLGACCLPDGSCAITEELQCTGQAGSWLGNNSICSSCPCVVACPNGTLPEGEPTCGPDYVDEFNGGCDAELQAFSPIGLCESVCGESGTFDVGAVATGDFDWYEVTVEQATTLTWNIEAEFVAVGGIVDGNEGCETASTISAVAATECFEFDVTAEVEPGVYWLIVGPFAANDLSSCGTRYVATLSATSCNCPADLNGDNVVDAVDLAALLGGWGANPGSPADFNDDDVVDAQDLAQLLGSWGPCAARNAANSSVPLSPHEVGKAFQFGQRLGPGSARTLRSPR